jgi:hypothetical protein
MSQIHCNTRMQCITGGGRQRSNDPIAKATARASGKEGKPPTLHGWKGLGLAHVLEKNN